MRLEGRPCARIWKFASSNFGSTNHGNPRHRTCYNSPETRLNAIYAAYQDPPVIRSIDLRKTSINNGTIEESEEDQFVGDSGTGTKDSKNTSDVDSEGAQEDETTVRFQYDGILNMDVKYTPVNGAVLPDLKDCYESELGNDVDSFHVMVYLTFFYVRVDLEYVLIERSDPSMSLTCDIIENNITVSVASNLDIDSDTSFAAFWKNLQHKRHWRFVLTTQIMVQELVFLM